MTQEGISHPTFFIVDGAPVSETLWRWFYRHAKTFDAEDFERNADDPEFQRDFVVPFFLHGILPSNSKPNLLFLNAANFLTFLENLMVLACGLDTNVNHSLKISQCPPSRVLEFVEGPVKQTLLYWCLTEDHQDAMAFEDLPASLFNDQHHATNRNYHLRCYYLYHEIVDQFTRMDKSPILQKIARNEINTSYLSSKQMATKDELNQEIRKIYRGDLGGFVIETIESIQLQTMSKNHEKLAQAVRYEKLQILNFEDNTLSPSDSWRYIFPTYFDQFEDYFDKFFEAFTGPSILHYLQDFAKLESYIHSFPTYGLFYNEVTERIDTAVERLVDMNYVFTRAKRLYGLEDS